MASCWLDASCLAGEAAAFLLLQRDVPWLQAAVAVGELFAAAAGLFFGSHFALVKNGSLLASSPCCLPAACYIYLC